MKVHAKIVGMGERRKGISQQNNRAYDFIPVAFLYESRDIQGYKALTVNVQGVIFDDRPDLMVNDEVDLVIHDQNFRTYVDAIL